MSDPQLQIDVGNLPFTTLSAVSSLVKAVSADSTRPEAVEQIRALGSCYLSNGPWAAQLPDRLERYPSIRVGRFAAWVGWEQGDTASFMSESPGGRTASIICFALGNLYSEYAYGAMLHELSSKLLIPDQHNSSIIQLTRVSSCLAQKLNCSDWGKLFAEQVTRLRQCFFDSGLQTPQDLADTPVDEIMPEFLLYLHEALQDENSILRFHGSTGAGVFISLVLFMCPEDVRI
jgi:hypothetical protein